MSSPASVKAAACLLSEMTTLQEPMITTDSYEYPDYSEEIYAHPCSLEHTFQFAKNFSPVVYSLLFVLAVVGNIFVLCVVQRYHRSCYGPCSFSLTDTFLLHLAVSDLLLALTLPFYAVQWAQEWVFGDAGCKIISAIFSLNLYGGILFLACISFDRYLAIVHAVSAGWHRRSCHAQVACSVVWIVCLSLACVDIQYREVVEMPHSGLRFCQQVFSINSSTRWRVTMQLVNMFLGFGLPLMVMLYCYIRIFRSLCHASRRQKGKSLRLIISLLSVFLVCWAPYNGFRLADSLQRLGVIGKSCQLYWALDIGTMVSETLGLAHCALNPLLYGFVGVKFRRELLKIGKGVLRSLGCLGLDGWGQKQSRRRGTASLSLESENTSYFSVMS